MSLQEPAIVRDERIRQMVNERVDTWMTGQTGLLHGSAGSVRVTAQFIVNSDEDAEALARRLSGEGAGRVDVVPGDPS